MANLSLEEIEQGQTTPAPAPENTPTPPTPPAPPANPTPNPDPPNTADPDPAAEAAATAEAAKNEGGEDTGATGDEPGDALAFWETVNNLRGEGDSIPLEPILQELGNDPDQLLLPESVHKILRTAEQKAIEAHEKTLSQQDPRAYAYRLHRLQGGSDEDFFSNQAPVLPTLDDLKNSIDLQKQFYSNVLRGRGLDDDIVKLAVEETVKKNTLFDTVSKEYTSIETQQKEALARTQQELQARVQRETEENNKLASQLSSMVMEGKNLSIQIPDTEKDKFLSKVFGSITRDQSGKYLIVQELTPEAMATVVESMYYQYVNGNLSKLIAKKAATDQVSRIRLKLKQERNTSAAGSGGTQTKSKPPLQDL